MRVVHELTNAGKLFDALMRSFWENARLCECSNASLFVPVSSSFFSFRVWPGVWRRQWYFDCARIFFCQSTRSFARFIIDSMRQNVLCDRCSTRFKNTYDYFYLKLVAIGDLRWSCSTFYVFYPPLVHFPARSFRAPPNCFMMYFYLSFTCFNHYKPLPSMPPRSSNVLVFFRSKKSLVDQTERESAEKRENETIFITD